MVANRGAPSDYDEWDELGAEGWNWESVLPYFRKLETDCDFDNEFHGQDGPITIRRRPPQQCSAFVRAARDVLTQKGLSERADQNGLWEDGFYSPALAAGLDSSGFPFHSSFLTADVAADPSWDCRPRHGRHRLVFDGSTAIGADIVTTQGVSRVAGARDHRLLRRHSLARPADAERNSSGGELQTHGINVMAEASALRRNLLEHPLARRLGVSPRGFRLPTMRSIRRGLHPDVFRYRRSRTATCSSRCWRIRLARDRAAYLRSSSGRTIVLRPATYH